MTQMTEQSWSAFRDGDLNGFGRLIEHYQDDVFAVAFAVVGDRTLAEDVAQETFIAAYTCRDRLRDATAAGGWLAAIARNLGRDRLRARKRERLVDAPDLDAASSGELPSQQLERATVCREVRRALDRVPAKYREVLILYYSYEHSIASIADSLGLSESAALQRLSRGRKLVERHGASLRELAGSPRPNRSFATAVIALLALRSRAHAAPARSGSRPQRLTARTSRVIGLAAVLAFVNADDATGQHAAARPMTYVASPTPATARPPTFTTRPIRIAATDEVCPAAAPAPAPAPPPPAPRPRPYPRPTHDALPHSVAPPLSPPAAVPSPAALGLVEPSFDCQVCATTELAPPPAAPKHLRWDIVNGYLETAALPTPGDISYETIALGMIVRAGLTRHIAAHVGMIGMDIVRGSYENGGSAFGGGIKIGGSLTDTLRVAVVAEGARNINIKTASIKDEWIGRAYASVTHGTPQRNLTLSAGVVGTDQGTVSALSPVLGVGSQVGWDDRLAFVLESQYFPRPYLGVDSTAVFAVRFREHDLPRNVVHMEQVRIDVGALLIDKANDYRGLPWLQVGLGW